MRSLLNDAYKACGERDFLRDGPHGKGDVALLDGLQEAIGWLEDESNRVDSTCIEPFSGWVLE